MASRSRGTSLSVRSSRRQLLADPRAQLGQGPQHLVLQDGGARSLPACLPVGAQRAHAIRHPGGLVVQAAVVQQILHVAQPLGEGAERAAGDGALARRAAALARRAARPPRPARAARAPRRCPCAGDGVRAATPACPQQPVRRLPARPAPAGHPARPAPRAALAPRRPARPWRRRPPCCADHPATARARGCSAARPSSARLRSSSSPAVPSVFSRSDSLASRRPS